MPKKHSGYVRRIPNGQVTTHGSAFSWHPHSFGQLVHPEEQNEVSLLEAKEFGYVVELHCECMSMGGGKLKPWSADEFERITKKEFELLERYHDETCDIFEELWKY